MSPNQCTVEIILAVSFKKDPNPFVVKRIKEFCTIHGLVTEAQIRAFLANTNSFEDLTIEQKVILLMCALKLADNPTRMFDYRFASMILNINDAADIRDFLGELEVDNMPHCYAY